MSQDTSINTELPPLPPRIGPCRLLGKLGEGAWGSVHLAELVEPRGYAPSDARVAIKVLRPDRAIDPRAVRRFEREARIGVALRHPGVVRIHETGRHREGAVNLHYLVMEYVEGRTLRALMDQLGLVPEPLLRAIAVQIAAGLAALHQQHVTHRDVKPTNVLITRDYQVRLSDLGLAWLADDPERLTATHHVAATLHYAAPEQLQGEPVISATDLYALGVVLYEAATGVNPFAAPTPLAVINRHLQLTPRKPSQLNPALSAFLDEVISCLLAKDPSQRMTATRLVEVLDLGERSTWWRQRESAVRAAHPRGELRHVQIPRDTPFAGRGREIRLVAEAQAAVGRGEGGRVALVAGEAGVGKTRLLDELAGRLEAETSPPLVLRAAHPPSTGRSALFEALVGHFGEGPLEARLAQILPGGARLARALAAVLTGLPTPPEIPPLTREEVGTLLARLARDLARPRSLLWIVEDLHFASADALALFETLAAAAPAMPILLVATCRIASGATALRALERIHFDLHLELGRLTEMEVLEMLAGVLGDGPSNRAMARQISRRSDGNPFFACEMLHQLGRPRQANSDAPTAGSTDGVFNLDAAPIAVPSTLRDLVLGRLRDLDEEDRALLDVASVQGTVFDPHLIAVQRDRRPLEVLERLAGLERRSRLVRAQEHDFRFDHNLLQEVVYESLPPPLRRAYHASLAAALAGRRRAFGEPHTTSGEETVQLCGHYLRGGETEAGRQLALRALDHLGASYQTDRHGWLANLILEAAGETDPRLRAEVRLRQADVHYLLGRRVEERAAARDALAAAAQLGDQGLAARARLSEGRTWVDSESAADEVLEDALRRARTAGDDTTAARVIGQLGHVRLRRGDFAGGRSRYEEQERLAEAAGDAEAAAEARYYAAEALLGERRFAAARTALERSIGELRAVGARRTEARALADRALASFLLGEYVEARRHYQASLALCRDIGFLEGEALALGNSCVLALAEGALDEAEGLAQGCLDLARSLRATLHESYAWLYLGEVGRARGDLARARRQMERALDSFRGMGADYGVVESALALARVLLVDGERDQARTLLEEAQRLVEKHGMKDPSPLPALYRAWLEGTDTAGVEVPEDMAPDLAAEAHWMRYRTGGGEASLGRCLERLDCISMHLNGATRAAFVANHPVAREARAEAERLGTAAGGRT